MNERGGKVLKGSLLEEEKSGIRALARRSLRRVAFFSY